MAAQVRYVIVGHHKRGEMAVRLAEQLEAAVSMDYGQLGSNANHDRSWYWASTGKEDWSAVLEDDIELTPNFHQHVLDAIQHVPTEGVLSLYTGYHQPAKMRVKLASDRAIRDGKSFLRSYSLYWGPAVVMPTNLVRQMLSGVTRYNQFEYDQRFTCWTRRDRVPVYYTVPSLVEHVDIPSLVWGIQTSPRKARLFGEPTGWNSEFVDL